MTKNSFSFGSCNSVDNWGIRVITHDLLMPPKRARKLAIPCRNGMYDYGSQNYDERTLRIECTLEKHVSKSDFRAIIYELSKKKPIRLWDEPDKYYVGELFDPSEVFVYPAEIMRDFELNFICEPFAYGERRTEPFSSGVNPLTYHGTAQTSPVIDIRNPNRYSVSNITIIAIKRRE